MASTTTAPDRATAAMKPRRFVFAGAWEQYESVKRWRIARERVTDLATPANRKRIAALWAAVPVAVRRCMEANVTPHFDRRGGPTNGFYWQLLGELGEFARQAERNTRPGHPVRDLFQEGSVFATDRADDAPLPTLRELIDLLERFHALPDAAKREAMNGWRPYDHAPFRSEEFGGAMIEIERFGAYEQTECHALQLSGGDDFGRTSITHTLVADDGTDRVHVLIAAGTSKAMALATLKELQSLMEEHWDTLTDYASIVGVGSVPETKRSGAPETQTFATRGSKSEEEALMPTAA